MRQFIAATLVALISPLSLFARETERTIGLDEVTVTANRRNVLYSVGYLREFSELTTGGDTVFMFREKWVDFMTKVSNKKCNGHIPLSSSGEGTRRGG